MNGRTAGALDLKAGVWDLEADVVVLGYGYAGGIAAIAAHDSGASALILEKEEYPGGISILSGGGLAIADDAEEALRYLLRTSGGATREDVLRAYAEGLVWLPEYVEGLAKVCDAVFDQAGRRRGGTYPFPGGESLGSLKITSIPDFTGYPNARGLRGGGRYFKVVEENVLLREIPVHLRTAGRRLVTDGDGAVVGVVADQEGREVRVKARRGVILACGGFEHSEELKRHFLEAQPVYGISSPANEGDGIRMAQKVGAAIWHMWHVHGSYGFKVPEFPIAFRHCVNGPRNPKTLVQWIVVDRDGNRFMDEYPPAVQDTGIRPLEYWDADTQRYPRIPCYLVLDDDARKLKPMAIPMPTRPETWYSWSEDNLAEVERGWIKRADTIPELAGMLGLPADNLVRSVERWNAFVDAGEDGDFGRVPSTMLPIRTPPFYGAEQWPIVSNTQGGPVHNGHSQVLDPFGEPIPRLYAAGECGSLFGHVYLESGNNAECFITGRIAGEHAASLSPWDE
jgi:succinate dehydrogenase/fumarate reductase flavoprotein subunit